MSKKQAAPGLTHRVKKEGAAKGKAGRRRGSAGVKSAPGKDGSLPPIVGIGGSAGGFESVMKLLKTLPADAGMALVVIQHLDPNHASRLAELIGRVCAMPVHEITHGMKVQPNHVYVLPANADVRLSHRTLELSRRPLGKRLHLPIDLFFQSLAKEEGDRAVGVVLSGTGTDGTLGLGHIKAGGGITFAEAEKSAKYWGMPQSAITAGCVDSALTPEKIARELVIIGRHPHMRYEAPQSEGAEQLKDAEDGGALGKIFSVLKHYSAVDFSRYKRNTVQRRISRRMALHRMEKLEDYTRLLRSDSEEVDALFQDMLINVTSFFRDKAAFDALSKKILPKIIKRKQAAGHELRIWVPGCSTGEEAYSLAILIVERLRRFQGNLRVHIFGTDLSEAVIAKARAGIYSENLLKAVSPERLRLHFTKVNGHYQINRAIRDMCTFARQDICEDPPFSRLDLISCRNLLIYLGHDLQKRCFPIFHYALNPGGCLLLGTSETTGNFGDLFTLVDKRNKIYTRKVTPHRPEVGFGKAAVLARPGLPKVAAPAPHDKETASEIQKQADRIVLGRFSPAGVIIDPHMQVLQFRGSTGPYLEHAAGAASLSLLQMVRHSLVMDLRAAIHQALKQDLPARKQGVPMQADGVGTLVDLEVIPYKVSTPGDRFMLVLFQPSLHSPPPADEADSGAPHRKKGQSEARRRDQELRLREELNATKETLQSIIEEQESTNEELKSANEEIESSNEELQSTNEELETAKEELQSTNEELHTLNEELNTRNQEMATVNNDLGNLLSSIHIPIVMVDNALTVRRITPHAEKFFNLLLSDVGRRLTDIRPNLHVPDLGKLIRKVIDTLETCERAVQDKDGHWFSLRIRPYRTRENQIDGAVIALVDIDALKLGMEKLTIATEYIAAVAETVREPVIVLDEELRVLKANAAFYKTFRVAKKETEGRPIYSLGNGQWEIPELRTLLETILPKNHRIKNFKVEHSFPKLGRRTMLLNARRLDEKPSPLIVLAISEIVKNPAGT